jgi:D-alanyl-D-alanine carboxypeptidase/D-alanyl-D-alanine-endopeptidase (penicillin-binding protein 4)
MIKHTRRSVLGLLGAVPVAAAGLLSAGPTARAEAAARAGTTDAVDPWLADRITEIIGRSPFAGSHWGMRFGVVGGDNVYSLNPTEQFVAGSAFKVFIAGSVLSALGPDHRFRTTVHRTGPVVGGTVRGNLVLVAGGDLLLGPRIQSDGTLALPVPDHTYGSATAPVPGDPLQQLRNLAQQVARRGIRRVEGRVVVDASLFRQDVADTATGGIKIPVSPMMINDNIIDVVVSPAGQTGAPGGLRIASDIAYLTVLNETTTVANPVRRLKFSEVSTAPNGTRTVRLTGDLRLGGQPVAAPYYLPDPVRFAEFALARVLDEAGVDVAADPSSTGTGGQAPVAEYVSPPLTEQVKPMLKVSSNPHTAYWPYLVGAIAGRDPEAPKAAGDRYQREIFERAGVNPDEGADDRYTSDFFVQFLTYITRQRYFTSYRNALPIMGRDGSLSHVLPDSPAAGRVFAKSGTAFGGTDLHKALAGYILLPDDRVVVFAQFMHMSVSSPSESMESYTDVETVQGEIANAVYASLTR